MKPVYVLGGAQSDFSRNWSKEGKNMTALLREVICDALDKVDISFEDIKELNRKNRISCCVGNFNADCYIQQGHIGALLTRIDPAFYGVPSARYEAACASGSVAIEAGMHQIMSEERDIVIVVGAEIMKSVDTKSCASYLGHAAYYETEARDIAFPFPNLFAHLAEETIKKYSLNEEEYLSALTTIATINYSNAKNNPNAQTRTWFFDRDKASDRGKPDNPIIAGILANSDCSQVTDGAACVVLASEKYIRLLNKEKQVSIPLIKGYGVSIAPMEFKENLKYSAHNAYLLPFTRKCITDAYSRANLSMEDMDVFETHDCFTSSEYAAISAFGITDPGLEYLAINNGDISSEGKHPINPSGGLIGCGHPVGASGVRMLLDLYKQVTNDAGCYQIMNARNGIMLNIGGSAVTNYSFIVGID